MRRPMRRPLLPAALIAALLLLSAAAIAAGPAPHVVVFFGSWSAKLDDPAMKAIQGAADWAKQHPDKPLTVIGYASTVGGTQANDDLSKLRAQMVSDTLVADGVAAARIRRHAMGAVDYTLDPQETRRVEIALGEE